MTSRFLVEAKTASLSEWQNATVILKELFATEETFSVGMTIAHCHSERAFRDWRNFLCRNDNTPLSFWKSFSRLKNLCLSEWQKDSSSKQKKLLCRNDNTPLSFWKSFSRLKKLSLSEWQYATVILKELFATEETFSVGMTKRHCHSEGAFRDWRIFACRNDKKSPLQ